MGLLLAVLGIIAAAPGPVEAGYWTRGDRPTLDGPGIVWIVTGDTLHNIRTGRDGRVLTITEEPNR